MYRRGWNVEWSHAPQARLVDVNTDLPQDVATIKSKSEALPNDSSVGIQGKNVGLTPIDLDQRDLLVEPQRIGKRGIQRATKVLPCDTQSEGQKQVHSKATLSLLLGIVSICCVLAPVLISGLGLAVILGLVALLIVTALLAQKMSRIALEDMHMARNRYAGKAMAVAGMILSVLALVALIGIVIIAVLGLAFVSLV
jgi:hypothetical protein